MLIGGRILNGITVGITSSQVPVYLAEVAKHSQRGTIIIIQQLAIEWGILIMYFIGYGCSFIAGDDSFRTAWSMQFVPCVFFMAGLPFLPESPRWLAMKDRTEQAIHVLANIQAGGDLNDPYVVAQYEEIVTVLAAERAALKGWRKFVYNGMWRRTLAGFSVQAWQQLSGANVMTCGFHPAASYYPQMKKADKCRLRRLYLLHGRSFGQHQPGCWWSAVRSVHHLLLDHVFLR